jgi:hypothetical protein
VLERVHSKLTVIEEVPEVLNAAHFKAKVSIIALFALKDFHDALHQTILHGRVLLHTFKVRKLHQKLYSASLDNEIVRLLKFCFYQAKNVLDIHTFLIS